MIKQEIIVVPKIPVQSSYQPNWAFTSPTQPQRLTQDEYAEYLKNFPFHVGEFVTIGTHPINRIGAVSYVMRIQQFAGALLYRNAMNDGPLSMQVMQCTIDTNSRPWMRWDCKDGYRHLSSSEIERLIVPNNDKLQDYCKLWSE
jgi:hypothetical protein